jgi:hypothetical protein
MERIHYPEPIPFLRSSEGNLKTYTIRNFYIERKHAAPPGNERSSNPQPGYPEYDGTPCRGTGGSCPPKHHLLIDNQSQIAYLLTCIIHERFRSMPYDFENILERIERIVPMNNAGYPGSRHP